MSVDIRLLRRNGLENAAAAIADTPHDVLFDEAMIKRATPAELDRAREWLAERLIRVIEEMDHNRVRRKGGPHDQAGRK